jgi:hypothetical protein
MTDPIHPDPARRDPASRAAVPGDASLQDQIHAVRANQAQTRTGRRGTSKLVVGGALVAAIVALWQFGPRFGWGPGGRGPGNGQGGSDRMGVVDDSAARTASSTQKPAAQPAQRPLRVQIDGTRYLVDGKEVDLPTLTHMAAQVPPGDGPAVEVKRTESSRVKAEQDLKAALEKENLPTTWMPPLE